jgi:hypothetical protein
MASQQDQLANDAASENGTKEGSKKGAAMGTNASIVPG